MALTKHKLDTDEVADEVVDEVEPVDTTPVELIEPTDDSVTDDDDTSFETLKEDY